MKCDSQVMMEKYSKTSRGQGAPDRCMIESECDHKFTETLRQSVDGPWRSIESHHRLVKNLFVHENPREWGFRVVRVRRYHPTTNEESKALVPTRRP